MGPPLKTPHGQRHRRVPAACKDEHDAERHFAQQQWKACAASARRAAAHGSAQACFRLGYLRMQGLGVLRDWACAARCFQAATAARRKVGGCRASRVNLALMYAKGGFGLVKNVPLAIHWLQRQIAQRPCALCFFHVGVFSQQSGNSRAAEQGFCFAAAMGHVGALLRLGTVWQRQGRVVDASAAWLRVRAKGTATQKKLADRFLERATRVVCKPYGVAP